MGCSNILECFNKPEIKQLEKVLNHCGNGGDCAKCDYDWMEDHGLACYREWAKASLAYIEALKEVLDTYDKEIDMLMEEMRNG